jgi:transposase-like protein
MYDDSLHQAIIADFATGKYSKAALARKYGINRGTVLNILKSAENQPKLQEAKEQINDRRQELRDKAIETQESLWFRLAERSLESMSSLLDEIDKHPKLDERLQMTLVVFNEAQKPFKQVQKDIYEESPEASQNSAQSSEDEDILDEIS